MPHAVAAHDEAEVLGDAAAVEYETHVFDRPRRTHGDGRARRAQAFQQFAQPRHGPYGRCVDFAVDALLLGGERLDGALADELRGQQPAQDVVVAHAVGGGEFPAPVGHAVPFAEPGERLDVHGGIVHQHAVHVE